MVELIAQADETGLAASGLACLDRCVPLLGGDDQVLRPLWVSLADGAPWDGALADVREALASGASGASGGAGGDAAALALRMLDAVPAQRSAASLRPWADGCSAAALQIHRLLDGTEEGVSPLVSAELRRQVRVLELLGAGGGLRQALAVSTEGRRVLQAVVSRSKRVRTSAS
ncbi:hypothetical protein [Streptomyces sp. NPDC059063]|uniref:hypothetical protein n=1 Tax=unclassified Streptomyces TaxID=2593676 RepID=UPI0036B4F108